MFGCFITATVLAFIMIFLSPWAVSSHPPSRHGNNDPTRPPHRRVPFVLLRSLPFTILTFLTGLFAVVGAVIGTVMFIIFKNVFAGQNEVNIKAALGKQMFVFMWIAAGSTVIAFLLELGTCFAYCCCCCGCCHRSRRSKLSYPPEKEDPFSPISPMSQYGDGSKRNSIVGSA